MTLTQLCGRRKKIGSPAAIGRLATALLVSAAIALVSCSSSGTRTQPAAPASQRPSFRVTWLPSYFDSADVRTAPQYVRWTGPGGQSTSAVAEAFIFTGSRQRLRARLTINAVTAAAFPEGYWEGFAASESYQHATLGELQTAIRAQGSTVIAISSADGYILQTNAVNVPGGDVKHFLAHLYWQRPR